MANDPFGRAIRDHHYEEQTEPLIQRDGEETLEHPIERFYFEEITGERDGTAWIETQLSGPLLDIGAGAGKHALYFQEQFETVAIEVSDHLVEVMCDRGVEDARMGDMFELRSDFEHDRFQSALLFGTQIGLVGSLAGLRRFLCDLAHITTQDATAVVHNYDPDRAGTRELLGFRADPTPGCAFRVMTFEYEGEIAETLLFRLFSPDRLREATIGTDWTVSTVRYGPDNSYTYLATLEK